MPGVFTSFVGIERTDVIPHASRDHDAVPGSEISVLRRSERAIEAVTRCLGSHVRIESERGVINHLTMNRQGTWVSVALATHHDDDDDVQ